MDSFFKLGSVISAFLILSVGCVTKTTQDSVGTDVSKATQIDIISKINSTNTSISAKGQVRLGEVKVNITFVPYRGKKTGWLGAGDIPELVIKSLSISLNGKKVLIDKRLYQDFSEISVRQDSIKLYETELGFKVDYTGSYSAASYGATFFIDSEGLYKMTVTEVDPNPSLQRLMKTSVRYNRAQ